MRALELYLQTMDDVDFTDQVNRADVFVDRSTHTWSYVTWGG